MRNSTVTSVQGQMWDQLSLARYGDERGMRQIAEANLEFMDSLVLPGGKGIAVPVVPGHATQPVRTLPPWERM